MLRDFIQSFFQSYPLAISAVIGLIAGFGVRLAINAKQKRKLLMLEDRMLNRHARILRLESKKAALEKINTELKENTYKKAALKAS